MSERRVVVTGLGVVNALGNDVKTFWNNLLNGVSGAKKLNKYFNNYNCKSEWENRSVIK